MSEKSLDSQLMLDPYAEVVEENLAPQKAAPKRFRLTPFSIIAMVAVLFFVGVVIWGIYSEGQGTVKAGDEAPVFDLQLYDSANIVYNSPVLQMDLSNTAINLADFRGDKVVIINFWQTNCIPCHQEAPMLVQLYADYQARGVVLLGVNVKDPDRVAYEYMAQYGIVYPNGLDRGDEIQKMYRTTGQPETFVIDRNGKIIEHFVGPPSEIQLREAVEEALAESDAA